MAVDLPDAAMRGAARALALSTMRATELHEASAARRLVRRMNLVVIGRDCLRRKWAEIGFPFPGGAAPVLPK